MHIPLKSSEKKVIQKNKKYLTAFAPWIIFVGSGNAYALKLGGVIKGWSKMKLFENMVNDSKPSKISAKSSILDVLQGYKCVSNKDIFSRLGWC